jgi:hypothetical protein
MSANVADAMMGDHNVAIQDIAMFLLIARIGVDAGDVPVGRLFQRARHNSYRGVLGATLCCGLPSPAH